MDLAKLEFDREFFAYLPRHTSEEHERLEEQLLAEGIADRIRVWATTGGKRNDKLIVVDGHERVAIARKHELPVGDVIEMEFASREEAKLWMSRNQIARRNVTKAQHDYHLGQIYNSLKISQGGDRKSEDAPGGSSADMVAEEAGVSKAKVTRAGKFAEAVDAAAAKAPEVREALNEGKRLSPAKLKAIAEAKTKEQAKKLAAQAIGGEEESAEPVDEPLVKDVKDAHGKPVTDHRYYSVFQDMGEFDRLAKELRKIETGMMALLRTPAGANLNFDDVVKASFKHIHAELKNKKPSRICTKCRGECEVEKGGKNIECSACVGLGFLDVQQVAMQG